MFQLKALVSERRTVDALTTSTVASREVSSLRHEICDDAMEGATCIGKLMAAVLSPS